MPPVSHALGSSWRSGLTRHGMSQKRSRGAFLAKKAGWFPADDYTP